MAHISHKLSGSFEGALAGGGDPATSPLYVFGPFLKLLVTAGVASVCFGAAVWMAVITVVAVSLMYGLVMRWVTDGSGGSGLNEEEFGGWAVTVNASITVIEYTLTFLVSIAALVTFLVDRLPGLGATLAGLPIRTWAAVGLSVLVGLAVNRGPKVAARLFGPATLGVLLLLWSLIVATIWQRGLHLPAFDIQAFSSANLHLTLGGYARILALMTGIEIFANLVAAYDGTARERSRKAFGSLVIVMGTTLVTMLVVGPAIAALADPLDPRVSVFTQTMDQLLPKPLAWAGSLVGIAVLLSAAAASAQGIQNLALGLRARHYLPAWLARRNRAGVSARPVWAQVALCVLGFLLFGTHEETWLALYAAGVFVLLSLTGWAVFKRLLREGRRRRTLPSLLGLAGTGGASLLTTGATLIIFEERFADGAWAYFLLVPLLTLGLARFRRRLGPPGRVEDRLGLTLGASPLPQPRADALYTGIDFKELLVPLDQSPQAELALATAQTLARQSNGTLHLLTVLPPGAGMEERESARDYLADVQADLDREGLSTVPRIEEGDPAERIHAAVAGGQFDAILMTRLTGLHPWLVPSTTLEVGAQARPPLLVVRPTESWRSTRTRFRRLLVALDGSELAERALPYAHALATKFQGELILLSVPEGSESDAFPEQIQAHLDQHVATLSARGVQARAVVGQGVPDHAILDFLRREQVDLVLLVSQGRGGAGRPGAGKLGSVARYVLERSPCPVMVVSAR